MNKAIEAIVDNLLAKIEAGNIPWKKPWIGGSPQNLDGRRYTGMNSLILGLNDYESNEWGTFEMVKKHGGSVNKGEKGTHVIFWKINKFVEKKDNEDVEKVVPFMRSYVVFNRDQTSLPKVELNPIEKRESCEDVVKNFVFMPPIVDGDGRAYYSPPRDVIGMPKTSSFKSTNGYYSTLFHEMAHSTGHKHRLNRKEVVERTYFGSDDYGKEELVAEICSGMLQNHCGFIDEQNNAAYIQNWYKAINANKMMLVSAAQQAQKAFDYIMNKRMEEAA